MTNKNTNLFIVFRNMHRVRPTVKVCEHDAKISMHVNADVAKLQHALVTLGDRESLR